MTTYLLGNAPTDPTGTLASSAVAGATTLTLASGSAVSEIPDANSDGRMAPLFIDAGSASQEVVYVTNVSGLVITLASPGLASDHAAGTRVDHGPDAITHLNYVQRPELDTYATDAELSAHIGNTSNPHAVTKAQVGLGSATNTSDADKPVSTAQATADALRLLISNIYPVHWIYDYTTFTVIAQSNVTLSGVQTVDGYTTTDNEYVLALNQTTGADRRIWITNSGGAWTAIPDDGTVLSQNGSTGGYNGLVFQAILGDHAQDAYIQTVHDPTVGTDTLEWTQVVTGVGGVAQPTDWFSELAVDAVALTYGDQAPVGRWYFAAGLAAGSTIAAHRLQLTVAGSPQSGTQHIHPQSAPDNGIYYDDATARWVFSYSEVSALEIGANETIFNAGMALHRTSHTSGGNAAQTLLPSDLLIGPTTALTATRTWTLPDISTVSDGHRVELIVNASMVTGAFLLKIDGYSTNQVNGSTATYDIAASAAYRRYVFTAFNGKWTVV